MRIELARSPGFESPLFGWDAVLIVGARGSARFSVSDGPEGERERHRFPLDGAAFHALATRLRALPDPVGTSAMDDVSRRHITCRSDDVVARWRAAVAATTPAEAEFDEIWTQCAALVHPVLIELGLPPALAHRW